MPDNTSQKLAKKIATSGAIAGRDTDPGFYSAMGILPNPDPILRRLGRAEDVFDAIMADSHVIGELRAVRAGLLTFDYRIDAGDENDPKSVAAAELCREWLSFKPAEGMTWPDVFWNMGTAVLRGFRVHELVWEYDKGRLLPKEILDRPNRRFRFDRDNHLRLLTKDAPSEGMVSEPYRFLLTRHMPSTENPYGRSLLSSCYWPYTFKHGGFRLFYKFCERHGLPWPVGRYPQGTIQSEIDSFVDALVQMLEDGAIAIPEGNSIELMTADAQGSKLVQHELIDICNREMSKALTSQTLATEQSSNGSRAAGEVGREREQSVNDSDRTIIEAAMEQAFEWITEFNFGPDVTPPTFIFYRESAPTESTAKMLETAARLSKSVPEAEVHRMLAIRQSLARRWWKWDLKPCLPRQGSGPFTTASNRWMTSSKLTTWSRLRKCWRSMTPTVKRWPSSRLT
ncbi:DUF935 family protein [Shewanella algae]|uniref:phage portal protein family protein n=1 Tax=Shewanella algae TaxID=38313 RepID=UPI001AAC74F1|nr:DUF935 family protein [Shewanella algae]MBO2656173.1 DUF935 family protein [Shewanella algae]